MLKEKEDLIVVTQDLSKIYNLGDEKLEVLKGINIGIPMASFTVICGPSGSGKTTLLNIIGGIDRPSKGRIIVDNEDLTNRDEDFLSDFRCHKIGFVFQAYNLVSTLTVAENVAFPMEWIRKPYMEIEQRVNDLLNIVGLKNRASHFPSQLSGGEQQRVAFARALANDPKVILADEPTGNLDVKNAQKIFEMLQLLKHQGKNVIVSTHDLQIQALADQVFCLDEGKLVDNYG